jgi:hypothetical protein
MQLHGRYSNISAETKTESRKEDAEVSDASSFFIFGLAEVAKTEGYLIFMDHPPANHPVSGFYIKIGSLLRL